MWQAADESLRSRMAQELKTRLQRASSAEGVNQLRAFLNLFGFHPLGQAARLALADRLIAAEAWLEAELVAGEIADAADRALAGAARAALAVIYEKAKRPELAARQYQVLAAGYGDVICRDGLTGSALARRAKEHAAVAAYLAAKWPVGEVKVTPSDVSSSNPLIAFQRLTYPVPITQFYGVAPRGLRASYDPQQQFLLAIRGDHGQTLATASLRRSDRPYFYAVQNYAMSAKANGHLVVVNLGAEIAAVDGLRGERGGEALLWRHDTVDFEPNSQRSIYPQQRATSNPLTGNRLVSYDPTGKVNFTTAPVRGIGFCFQRGRQLICVDPITGQSLWERGGIPPQAEVFGDEEFLFVAYPTGSSAFDDMLVLSAIDGTLVERRSIDKAERRWVTYGRNVLAWGPGDSQAAGSTVKVRLYDARSFESDVWSRQVPQGTRGCLIDGEEMALLEPSGQFTVVSLATGEVRLGVPLEPEPSPLAWIQVIRSSDQYLLLASQENTEQTGIMVQPMTTAGNQQTRMHGRVYAFERASGKLQWQTPAFIANHCLPADQPTESPLLLFIRNRSSSNQTTSTTKASVLALDRRDGRIVYQSDDAANQVNNSDCVVDPTKETVTLTLYSNTSKSFAFKLTDQPTPPQPPAQTGGAASTTAGQPRGRVDRSIGTAIDALNRGLIVPPPERRAPRDVPANPR
jgi:hypothetical protein